VRAISRLRASRDARRTVGLCVSVSLWFILAAATAGAVGLVEAAKDGDAAKVRALIDAKADVNAAEPDGTTALHWASYRDDVATADVLITAGARVNAATDLGVTPLWNASLNGSEAMVKRLLQAGANPNAALPSGETSVMAAARGGYAAVVEQLIAKGADVNARGARQQTALMWAAAQKHPEVVKVLLAHGADLQARSETWNEVMAVSPHGYLDYNRAIPHGSDTALLFAVRAGDVASATLLIAAGAGVNDEDAWGVSATAMAAHAGHRDLVVLLLEHGANANAARAGFSPLHAAIMRRDEAMVRALVAHGADVNFRVTSWTPTRRSSRDFHFSPELVGATPFWLAARFSEPEMMRLLVEHGANPRVVHHADYHTEEGANHRVEDTDALMAAAGMGGGTPWVLVPRAEREAMALETVKLAIELGADVHAVNPNGKTALDAAKAMKYESVVKYLVEQGAGR